MKASVVLDQMREIACSDSCSDEEAKRVRRSLQARQKIMGGTLWGGPMTFLVTTAAVDLCMKLCKESR